MGWFSSKKDDDDDDDQKFIPGPGFYNVSPVAEPVELLACDDEESLFLKEDGSYVIAKNVDNEGDA
jgi:hypothetical protein